MRVTVTARAAEAPARATSRPSPAVLPPRPSPTPGELSSAAASGRGGEGAALFEDRFDLADGLITNEYSRWNPASPEATGSAAWEVTSGSLFARGGAAWTGVPDGCPSSSPHSTPCTASDVFRLNTKEDDFGDVTVSLELVNRYLTSSPRTPAVSWDGVHIWLHHQSGGHVDRRRRVRTRGPRRAERPSPKASTESAEAHLTGALRLYQDGFLSEEPYLEWAVEERERLQELVGRALRAQVRIYRRAGRLEAAAANARRLVDMEPFDSDVQKLFIEICLRARTAQRGVPALRPFRKGMLQAFGQEPDFDLAEVERDAAAPTTVAGLAGEGVRAKGSQERGRRKTVRISGSESK